MGQESKIWVFHRGDGSASRVGSAAARQRASSSPAPIPDAPPRPCRRGCPRAARCARARNVLRDPLGCSRWRQRLSGATQASPAMPAWPTERLQIGLRWHTARSGMSPTRRPDQILRRLCSEPRTATSARAGQTHELFVTTSCTRDAGMAARNCAIKRHQRARQPACRWCQPDHTFDRSFGRPSGRAAAAVDALGTPSSWLGRAVARRGQARSRPAGGSTRRRPERGFEGSPTRRRTVEWLMRGAGRARDRSGCDDGRKDLQVVPGKRSGVEASIV